MTVVSNDDPIRHARFARVGHERLSDHGTHSLISDILSSGFLPRRPNAPGIPDVQVKMSDLKATLFPALKSAALQRATEIAHRARKRVDDRNRGWPNMTFAAICAEVLFDAQVRRGPVPSLEGRLCRQQIFVDALSREKPLRLAVLLFPLRDRNPAKNDGPSPDLGEVDALVQLWTITKALECARETFIAERLEVIQRALGEELRSHRDGYAALAEVLEPTPSPVSNDPRETVKRSITIARQNKERLTRRLEGLGGELAAYTIHDREKAAAVLLELAREDRSISWLCEGKSVQPDQAISVLAIRDARRYPCFDSDPDCDIQHYTDALSHLHSLLGLGHSVILTSTEELEDHVDPLSLHLFRANRQKIYQEKKEDYLSVFEGIKEVLLSSDAREGFLQRISLYDGSGKITPIFEAILHCKYHEPLIAWCSQFGVDSRQHALDFLATIYEPRCDAFLESLRKQLLWDTLIGAVEYVASYESNSQRNNRLQLDDVGFLAAGSVRLSIHQKPEGSGHFAVQVGASVHRTPWHGTAFVRECSQGKGYILESRLALELKYEQAIPIFLDEKLAEHGEWLREGSLNGHDGPSRPGPIGEPERQPFFWLERNLARKLLNKENLDSRTIIHELSTNGVRRS